MTIKEIRQLTNLSQVKFCDKYGIPLQTLCKWEQGHRTCPDYVAELLEFKVREDLKMKTEKISLNKILDFIQADTKITLYINEYTEIPSDVPVYDFPARHDLNQYYGHEVERIESVSERKIVIYLKGEEL